MRLTRFRPMLAALPLLLGADQPSGRVSALFVDRLPGCAADEYLTYASGGLRCAPLRAGSGIVFPDCTGRLLTVTMSGDVARLRCTAQGSVGPAPAEAARLFEAERRYQALDRVIRSWAKPELLYVGLTDVKTTGRIARPPAGVGLVAANDLCADRYPGARMCTVQDLHDSVAYGAIGETTRIAPAWIYAPAAPPDGLADTCSGYTSDLAAGAGVAVEWTALPTSGVGFLFHGGAKASCDRALPIACCGS